LLFSWAFDVHGCVLLGFVGVPGHALLGFAWCSWLCFPRVLLVFLIMLFKALLMFMVVVLLGFVGVRDCCFSGLLVFVVVVIMGFVGIHGHAFLGS
jgi:hypothetical protein